MFKAHNDYCHGCLMNKKKYLLIIAFFCFIHILQNMQPFEMVVLSYFVATTSTEAATTTSFKNTAVTTPASSPPTTTQHTTKTTNLLTTPGKS